MENEVRFPDVTVQLSGQDGNAVLIMGLVAKALRRAGYGDAVKEYMDEAMSGNYDHLVRVTMQTVNVS